jgi:hypothetical protein
MKFLRLYLGIEFPLDKGAGARIAVFDELAFTMRSYLNMAEFNASRGVFDTAAGFAAARAFSIPAASPSARE